VPPLAWRIVAPRAERSHAVKRRRRSALGVTKADETRVGKTGAQTDQGYRGSSKSQS
jgi:hypothetical protein